MPDLVTRLAGLHATLTARLSLRESLLSLSGRLDMVLQQVDLRSSVAPAPMASRGKKGKAPAHTVDTPETRRYVEGESEEEAEDVMEVELEEGSDAGSVEDVELGAGSESEAESDAPDEDDDDEEEEDEDEEDDDDDGEDSEGDSEGDEGPRLNGFIDDEAEEDEEDSESE
jgi:U3 small nucleolar RNA-associated protein 5